ncbi:MerC domain-containing protein [Bernardetia sp.]|uniref:MerC domain-containing protein n=1 Tax=Bernardetia sp. TaxID=1937974 RepID=UPI0025BEF6F2|nr:MerC domain-containing protein [Bernardetia sp.]
MTYYLSLKNKIKTINSDFVGAMSAFLCIVHCAIVPILMGFHSVYYAGDVLSSQVEVEHSHTHFSITSSFNDIYWHSLDYFFIVITLVAVFFATRKSIVSWIKIGLWSCASLFVVSILLENFIEGIEYLAYFASFLLIIFHFLNQRLSKNLVNHSNKEELNLDLDSFDNTVLDAKIESEKARKMSCAC